MADRYAIRFHHGRYGRAGAVDGRLMICRPPQCCPRGRQLRPGEVLVGHPACLGHGGGHTTSTCLRCDGVRAAAKHPLHEAERAGDCSDQLSSPRVVASPSSVWVPGRSCRRLTKMVLIRR